MPIPFSKLRRIVSVRRFSSPPWSRIHSSRSSTRFPDCDATTSLRSGSGPDCESNLSLGSCWPKGLPRLLDVSYGGCRLRFPQGTDVPLTRTIQLPVPTSDMTIRGVPVWHQSEAGGDVYGLSVTGPPETRQAWCAFVDGLAPEP